MALFRNEVRVVVLFVLSHNLGLAFPSFYKLQKYSSTILLNQMQFFTLKHMVNNNGGYIYFPTIQLFLLFINYRVFFCSLESNEMFIKVTYVYSKTQGQPKIPFTHKLLALENTCEQELLPSILDAERGLSVVTTSQGQLHLFQQQRSVGYIFVLTPADYICTISSKLRLQPFRNQAK